MSTLLCAGPRCLGDSGLPACASLRRHPQHSNTRQRCGFLSQTLQLLWWRPFSGIQRHCHRPTRQRRQAQVSEMDTGGRRPLCDRQAILLQWHLCRSLEVFFWEGGSQKYFSTDTTLRHLSKLHIVDSWCKTISWKTNSFTLSSV